MPSDLSKRYDLYNLAPGGQAIVRKVAHDDTDDEDGPDAVGEIVALDELRKRPEHGLSHLLNPTDPDHESRDWITRAWEDETRRVLGLATGPELAWLGRPALIRTTISTPRLRRAFAALNKRSTYPEQVKPFNFLLISHIAPLGHPAGADPNRFLLVAPYNPDPRQWKKLLWTNPYEPGHQLSHHHDRPVPREGRAREDLRRRARTATCSTNTEPTPNQKPWPRRHALRPRDHRTTRAPASPRHHHHSHRERSQPPRRPQAGLVHNPNEVLNEYRDPGRDPLNQLVHPVLLERPIAG